MCFFTFISRPYFKDMEGKVQVGATRPSVTAFIAHHVLEKGRNLHFFGVNSTR